MRLTVVGCSGSLAGPESPASCYLLEADGFRLVLDLGNGAVGALQHYTGLPDIDVVCLSHLHPDHCLGWLLRRGPIHRRAGKHAAPGCGSTTAPADIPGQPGQGQGPRRRPPGGRRPARY